MCKKIGQKTSYIKSKALDVDDKMEYDQVHGKNLDVEREAAQSESSFNSNPVRPAPDVDENVNLDLSVRSESESEDENMAVYDADTEVDDGPDVETNRYARAIINSKDQQLLSNRSRLNCGNCHMELYSHMYPYGPGQETNAPRLLDTPSNSPLLICT
ncbi:hypothetical protein PoB_004101200 [Plakobranchus ocellatus]|uniref:Uncharacterized protein n=1 Tax=Plakobranchus ocellatus TaxID=259542 RepID=A0AAV4B5Y2_9GAST|nr:hypothetical protein PoB_004101200 [Plakobranchus ocellatus]